MVVAQNFGDSVTDAAATSKLRELYPGRTVESLNVDPIAFGGGGIHCSTQQQPVGITSPTSTTTVTTSLQDGSVPNKTERATNLAIVSMIFGLLLQPHFLTV